MIRYLEDVHPTATFEKKLVPRRGFLQLAPGQGSDGYGMKISTDYLAKVNNKTYRVYATCISNLSSCWVQVAGEQLFLRSTDI